MKQARQQHQSVEEKEPAYLNIGRYLASQGIAPPSAPHLLDNVKHHRVAVDRHQTQGGTGLALCPDRQTGAAKIYHHLLSSSLFLAIILPLVSQSPPNGIGSVVNLAILAFDIDQFNKGPLAVRWRKSNRPLAKVAGGCSAMAARAPAVRLAQDVRRARASPLENDEQKEYVLIETKAARAGLAP